MNISIISSLQADETSIRFSDKSSGGRKPKMYNLDMILSVGYRVNSKRGIAFRRNALYRDDGKIISDGALVAITLMIAESRPEEKDIMVNLVMNFLTM